MSRHTQLHPSSLCLGIESGGTRTTACLAQASGKVVETATFDAANLKLVSPKKLEELFRQVRRRLGQPGSIGIGMAGARTEADRRRIRQALQRVWPGTPCHITHDLDIALAAGRGTVTASSPPCSVLVLSGTGSCCYGRHQDGRTSRMGGWGHVLGDKGSGYEIGLRALKAVVYYFDRDQKWSPLGQKLLATLQLNEPDDLIGWAHDAGKRDIAALAPLVFKAHSRRDPIAADILHGAASTLSKDAVQCARHLVDKESPVHFILAGGVLTGQSRFASKVRKLIEARWPSATVTTLKKSGVMGAVLLAAEQLKSSLVDRPGPSPATEARVMETGLATSPTEQRNPRSMNLDKLALGDAVDLMLSEEARVTRALRAERESLVKVIRKITRTFRAGGRLFYVGAGTSGRLGVLDASECPPTFHTDPEMVQGIMAGGQTALWQAVEGAEDDAGAGGRAVAGRGVTAKDVVVGIAASGRTPFVRGALAEAKRRKAGTIMVCFNPQVRWAKAERPGLVICPRVGPELLTGSTRLKAGTATKLILNMMTTLSMVQLGKTRSNLMVDVKASNSKLKDRAIRMVMELSEVDRDTAERNLRQSEWKIQKACSRLEKRASRG